MISSKIRWNKRKVIFFSTIQETLNDNIETNGDNLSWKCILTKQAGMLQTLFVTVYLNKYICSVDNNSSIQAFSPIDET